MAERLAPTIMTSTIQHLVSVVLPAFFAPCLNNKLIPSIFATNSNSASNQQSTSGTGQPSVPRFETTIGSFDRVPGYNYRALQLAPQIGRRRPDARSYAAGDLRPILVNLQTTFRTNEYTEMLEIVDAVFGRITTMQFITDLRDPNDEVVLSISNNIAIDFQFTPEDQPDTGQGEDHTLQFAMVLSTQTGRLVNVPSVLRVVFRNYVVDALDFETVGGNAAGTTVVDRRGDPVQIQSAGTNTVVGDLAAEVEKNHE